MRIAIVSDIHGNLTAFQAVLKDLKETSPDMVIHGGDLAHGGARPAEIVDLVVELGWPGVAGNADELLFRPQSLTEFARQSAAALQPLFTAIEEQATATRQALGEERIGWLRGLPSIHVQDDFALVHASPESLWRAPAPEATDAELRGVYESLGKGLAVYGHIHRAFVREIPKGHEVREMIVANTGSVSLSHDGDTRAAYLLLDEETRTIRRVEYDLEAELKALAESALPHAEWIARSLKAARPQLP